MNDPIPVSSALDEETARAEVYGLLAALYYAPPSAELMAQLRVAVTEAPAAGESIVTYDPENPQAENYKQLAQEVDQWLRKEQA